VDELDKPFDVEGVGLIIFDKGKSIFALSKQAYWIRQKDKGRVLISYGCVGGKIEQGETAIEAALREAREEMVVDIELLTSSRTHLIDLDLSVRTIKPGGEIKPFAIYFVEYPGKPGDPTKKAQKFIGKIHVFFAKLQGEPTPSSEVPAILWTDWEMVQKNIGEYVPLKKFLEAGRIKEQVAIPEKAHLFPMWTPEILGKTLDYKEIMSFALY
ncbi:MAG: NUDIX domain-containing protein, partial [Promethearchaeota archaeon]